MGGGGVSTKVTVPAAMSTVTPMQVLQVKPSLALPVGCVGSGISATHSPTWRRPWA